jgi:phosphatidylglycerophosphatase A
MQTLIRWIRKTGATVFFIGYFPVASGTVGSAAAAVALWFLSTRFPWMFGPQHYLAYWVGCVAVVALSIFFCSRARELFGADDPSPIVFDEVAGQMITFLMVPLTMPNLITGFLLFRFFDIIKPYPVYLMEELEEGVGVTMDDVMAGILANISLLTIHFLYHLVHGHL